MRLVMHKEREGDADVLERREGLPAEEIFAECGIILHCFVLFEPVGRH